MATFKVNDRVRIINPRSQLCGCEAVIYEVVHNGLLLDFGDVVRRAATQYRVDVVGFGRFDTSESFKPRIAYEAQDLAPLTPPQADEWADAKVREVTKPVYTEPERVKERV